MQQQEGRSGWSAGEEQLLFSQAEACRAENRPLRAAFEKVAAATGRRPNSVRNYYYARIKEQDLKESALHAGAFVPFSEGEIRQLLRTVLSAQAGGISVRACTLSMADGDNKAMLRYQNKYRSLLKTQPALVKQVAAELAGEGVYFDPYTAAGPSRAGRPRKSARVDAGELGRALARVEGMEGSPLLAELYALAMAAGGGAQAGGPLRERVRRLDAELRDQQERFNALLGMYRRLIGINRDFLATHNLSGTGAIAGYVQDLAHSVSACEDVLREYNA